MTQITVDRRVEADTAYHADPAVGRSKLWTMYRKTPAHARHEEPKDSAPLTFGKLAHVAILEPHAVEDRYMVVEAMNKNTNAWKALKLEAAAAGKEIIQQPDLDEVLALRDAVLRDPTTRKLVEAKGSTEVSYYAQDPDTGIMTKARPDRLVEEANVILDLKSTRSAMWRDFSKSIAEYGYHLQDFMYPKIVSRVMNTDLPAFVFLCVESDAPHLSCLYELTITDRIEAEAIYNRTIREYAACLATDSWPGYPSGVNEITMPRWAFTETGED